MIIARSYCWIAGYVKRCDTGKNSAPEEKCESLDPGEWEAGQRAADENLMRFECKEFMP